MQSYIINIDTLLVIIFLMANLIIGLRYSKNIKSIREFALGDRNFRTAAITVTLLATWISGSTFSLILSVTYSLGILIIFPFIGELGNLLITSSVLAPRMQRFLGKLSVVEAMGDIYGQNIRLIVGISSVIMSITRVALQIKVLSSVFYYFLKIESDYAVIISSIVVICYSTAGGIKSIILTDIFQALAFGAIIPSLSLFICILLGSWDSILQVVLHGDLFNPKTLFNYQNPQVLEFYGIFFYCLIPDISPAMFQRILLSQNVQQVSKAFRITAAVNAAFFVFSILIALMLLSSNPNINSNNLLPYIVDNYTSPIFKGLILIGLIAMMASTVDSWINSASIIFVSDICGSLGINMNSDRLQLMVVRLLSVALGMIGLYIALSQQDLLDVLLYGASFYTPIVGVPLLLTILGFRTEPRIILCGMIFGACTSIMWNIYLTKILPIGIIPATLTNYIAIMIMHYCFSKHGGWIKPHDPEPYIGLNLHDEDAS